ncbi:MAG: peptidoglycan bridge formation glycyltransferase FemA/FemB family protein [Flavobacteriaceae bacterium]
MIKTITSKAEWESALSEVKSFDFYHTFDYHHISKTDTEEAVLLYYRDKDALILLPLLLRQIFDTDFYDATSVYGYAGPLGHNINEDFSAEAFREALDDFFNEKKIIAVFSRLNPYIDDQDRILGGIGEIRPIGNVVNIDLSKSLDEQRSAYRRDTRSRVNKARRLCTVRKATEAQDIETFVDIYTETMTKLDADEDYFFDKEYFFNFLDCDGFKTDVLLAVHNETGEVTAGSMFVKTNNIVQYHLSGTRSEYMKIAPSRLLLDEMRIQATEEGYRFFNLGGGYKSREDALFNFKSSFSDDFKSFKIWTYIVNQDKYHEFMILSRVEEDTEFFPAYRAKVSHI